MLRAGPAAARGLWLDQQLSRSKAAPLQVGGHGGAVRRCTGCRTQRASPVPHSSGGERRLVANALLQSLLFGSGQAAAKRGKARRGGSKVPQNTGRGDDAESLDHDTLDAVVKVFCIHESPNHSMPWQRNRQHSTTSTGFVVEGRRILTNAHSCENFVQVRVRRRGEDEKFIAEVLAINEECDCALLTVREERFWSGLRALELGPLPRLQDPVTVVGYPIGGDTLSVTSGVVSRIEVGSYSHGSAELLAIQIDAAINSGNSGGPALTDDGKCAGIAFQTLVEEDAENIGYIVPTPVVKHFLGDVERLHKGQSIGFPKIGIVSQTLENASMRQRLSMLPEHKVGFLT